MESITTFHRFEKKYLLTPRAYGRLRQKLAPETAEDAYGRYTIASVYFDTDAFDIIRSSVQESVFKEKLRLRWYGDTAPVDSLFVELKRKYRGMVYKRRVPIDADGAARLLRADPLPHAQGQIYKEVEWFIARNRPVPKLLLAYDREALHGRRDETLRITFDHNIRWREADGAVLSGCRGTPLLPEDRVLMEIKAAQTLPKWLADLLAAEKIYPSSFSKYGAWYQQIYLGKGRTQHVG